jgi:hypothetical protein
MGNKNNNKIPKGAYMKKFIYNENVNIIFYNENDLSDEKLNTIRFQIGKRCVIGNGNGKFIVFMYKEKNQVWKYEKFALLHEIGHIEINDMSDEVGADEYAISKLGSDLALDALSYLFIDTVKETFADKDDRRFDDMHSGDTVEEKLSLVKRFGVQIYYGAPDKREYERIVLGLAEASGLDIERDVLLAEANKWELRHGGYSGRAARQLIDHLAGKV